MDGKQTKIDLEDVIRVGEAVWAENSDGYPIIKQTSQYLAEIQRQIDIRDSKYN